MGTQLMLSFAKRYFLNLSNALNPKPNSQTIRILSPYRNISLFSFVFILKLEDIAKLNEYECQGCKIVRDGFRKFTITVNPDFDYSKIDIAFSKIIESKEHGKISGHGGTILLIESK